MKRKYFVSTGMVLFFSMGLASGALADAPKRKRAKVVKTGTATKALPKTKTYSFTGDELEADRLRPEGTSLYAATQASHASLIRLRMHFIREVLKSANDL